MCEHFEIEHLILKRKMVNKSLSFEGLSHFWGFVMVLRDSHNVMFRQCECVTLQYDTLTFSNAVTTPENHDIP